MKKALYWMMIIAIPVIVLSFPKQVEAATWSQELVTNGGFEQGSVGWAELLKSSITGNNIDCPGCIINDWGIVYSGKYGALLTGYETTKYLVQYKKTIPSSSYKVIFSYKYNFFYL